MKPIQSEARLESRPGHIIHIYQTDFSLSPHGENENVSTQY